MTFTRKNVWELGGNWADPILWYARGVAAMKARALNDRTGWAFFGAIHGFDQNMWQQVGAPTDPMPSSGDFATYWQQCQHGTWYFEPWHRGYLMALEAMMRDAIKNMPGAPTDWALPYWNYFKPNQNALPPAFASPDWPDGTGNNPLFVQARYGPNNDGNVFVDMGQVDEDALGDGQFIGPAQGGSPGFGGVRTGWSHGDEGNPHGGIESQPHDMVHVLVGGGTQDSPGLMSDPDTAGLDPIFYLHHANIDRLWEVWLKSPTSQGNPNEANWLNGPASSGQRKFAMPMPDGTSWTYTPNDVKDLSTLNYAYDDVSPPAGAPQALARLQALGVAPAAAHALVRSAAMAGPPNVELLGANNQSIRVTGTEARSSVALEPAVKNKVVASLQALRAAAPTAAAPAAPDRVFLNLEHVRGAHDAHAFDVYINAPGSQRELKAGSVALFGVRKASAPDGEHAGSGLTFVLDITHVVDALHLSGALDANQLQVRLVPRHPVPDEAQISIGRISVFRQGK